MEKKNTVLLTVIAVATLLVAVVGATFAYFTATSDPQGTGTGAVDVDTATVADSAILNTTAKKTENTYYPGTINYAEAKVEANKGENPTNDTKLDVAYSITGSVTIPAELGSDVSWKLYKTTSPVANPIVENSCGDSAHTDGTGTKYYQTCQAAAELTDPIAQGTATKTDISDTGTLTTGTGATGGDTVYYYLVVEYINRTADGEGFTANQNAQQGKTISFQLDKATSTGTTTHTGA